MKFCVVFCRAIENLLLKTSPAVPNLFLTRLHKIRVAKGGKNLQRILIQLCNEYGWDCQIKHWQKVLATYAHRSVCFVRFFFLKAKKKCKWNQEKQKKADRQASDSFSGLSYFIDSASEIDDTRSFETFILDIHIVVII